jgi:hypothetical protein
MGGQCWRVYGLRIGAVYEPDCDQVSYIFVNVPQAGNVCKQGAGDLIIEGKRLSKRCTVNAWKAHSFCIAHKFTRARIGNLQGRHSFPIHYENSTRQDSKLSLSATMAPILSLWSPNTAIIALLMRGNSG